MRGGEARGLRMKKLRERTRRRVRRAWQVRIAVVSAASCRERHRLRAMMECTRAGANRSERPLGARRVIGLGRAGWTC
jgi:hypothetical protein